METTPTVAGRQPGPVYDQAVKGCLQRGLPALLALLGETMTLAVRVEDKELTGDLLTADLVATAGNAILHLEIERDGNSRILPRMFHYRGSLMERYPQRRIHQHILVLGRRAVPGVGDLADQGVIVPLWLTHAHDLDAPALLATVHLAPLAVLGRGMSPEAALRRALFLIHERGAERASELRRYATTLAHIRLPAGTIQKIEKEVGMTVEEFVNDWKDLEFGAALVDLGRREGRQEGQQEGRQEARRALLATILRDRFGEDEAVPAVAARLTETMTDVEALHAVTAATSLAELARADLSWSELA